MKNFFKKSVDERQEKELRTIESIAFWVMFWCLSLSILFQLFLFKAHLSQLAGELITLTIGAIIQLAGYVKQGEWGYYSNPSWKSYLLTGAVLALMAAVIFSFMVKADNRFTFIIVGTIIAFFVGLMLSAALGFLAGRKRKKLENEYDPDK